jgi:hypothetical protein
LGFNSKSQADKQLQELEHLRNELAHAQDIVTGRWPDLVRLASSAEHLLERCEDAA